MLQNAKAGIGGCDRYKVVIKEKGCPEKELQDRLDCNQLLHDYSTLRKNFFPGVALQILLMFVDFKSGCNDKRTFEKSENLTGTIAVTVKWRRGRTTPAGMIVAACLLCVQTGCSNRAGGEEARLIW